MKGLSLKGQILAFLDPGRYLIYIGNYTLCTYTKLKLSAPKKTVGVAIFDPGKCDFNVSALHKNYSCEVPLPLVENSKWIFCSRKTGVKSWHLRF